QEGGEFLDQALRRRADVGEVAVEGAVGEAGAGGDGGDREVAALGAGGELLRQAGEQAPARALGPAGALILRRRAQHGREAQRLSAADPWPRALHRCLLASCTD